MSIMILGIDLGKNSCSVVGLDTNGLVVVRRRMLREGVIAFAAKLAPCTMAMEACCGAHHMGRTLAALRHEVRLMSPEYVRPCVKRRKTTIETPIGQSWRRAWNEVVPPFAFSEAVRGSYTQRTRSKL